jgi:hypothetical protein
MLRVSGSSLCYVRENKVSFKGLKGEAPSFRRMLKFMIFGRNIFLDSGLRQSGDFL